MIRSLTRISLLTALLVLPTVVAHADIIDFKNLADVQWGESAWSPLTITTASFTVTITATKGGRPAYAYLDSGNAGLGVCGSLILGASADVQTHSTANICDPSDDDNVTTGEFLTLTFNKNVTIQSLWFDNDHDGDLSLLGDKINIGGSPYTFANGGASLDSFTTSPYFVSAGTPFVISYNNEEFYLSKITASAAPEPAAILLTGAGLISLALTKRRRKDV
jgi:hypothetical protein